MGKIAAGVVLYNPDDNERIVKSIKSVLEQVKKVYVFDNSTIEKKFVFPESVTYMTEHKNMGIAYALNVIMSKAMKEGYEWVITMDQDSVIPKNLIVSYEKYIDNKIAIICPQVIDSRRSYMKIQKEPEKEFVDFCITSASCTNINAWKNIGKYDNWLFIDLVDNDFCKRLIISGYKILRLNRLVLDQEFGKIIPKSKKIQNFWNKIAILLNNDNCGKLGYRKFVNPSRIYYTCRNIIYVNRKYKKYGKIAYRENYNCNGFFGFIICFILPSILRAKEKRKVFLAAIKGLRDGYRKQVLAWERKNNCQNLLPDEAFNNI